MSGKYNNPPTPWLPVALNTGRNSQYAEYRNIDVVFLKPTGEVSIMENPYRQLGEPAYVTLASDGNGRLAVIPCPKSSMYAFKIIKRDADRFYASMRHALAKAGVLPEKTVDIYRVNFIDGALVLDRFPIERLSYIRKNKGK